MVHRHIARRLHLAHWREIRLRNLSEGVYYLITRVIVSNATSIDRVPRFGRHSHPWWGRRFSCSGWTPTDTCRCCSTKLPRQGVFDLFALTVRGGATQATLKIRGEVPAAAKYLAVLHTASMNHICVFSPSSSSFKVGGCITSYLVSCIKYLIGL